MRPTSLDNGIQLSTGLDPKAPSIGHLEHGPGQEVEDVDPFLATVAPVKQDGGGHGFTSIERI